MKARRYVQSAKATALSAAVVLFGLAGVGPAAATHLKCGSVITTDTTLTHSIKGCTSRGLYIGADNITLNLGGFVVAGVYTGFNTYGIDTNGHSGVTVTNGIVKKFTRGIYISGGRNNTVRAIRGSDNTVSNNSGGGIVQSTHGPAAPLNITGNLVCNNARGGIRMTYEGNTIISNNVGSGTTGCLRNGHSSGYYDLEDGEAAQEDPEDLLFECRSTWRNNYTQGDTFNHPCVTK